MSLQTKSERSLRVFCLCVLLLLALGLSGCSEWKCVRKSHLADLADGIEWQLERVEPRADLDPEEKAKVERVGEKLLRNARALAE